MTRCKNVTKAAIAIHTLYYMLLFYMLYCMHYILGFIVLTVDQCDVLCVDCGCVTFFRVDNAYERCM